MDGEWARSGGWGRPHKYGNFVNQVSWRSVVEFFREIEGNVISQFSTASFFFSVLSLFPPFFFFLPFFLIMSLSCESVRGPGDLAGN